MNPLYAYHTNAIESKSQDIVLWKKFYLTIITANSSYIDRTGTIKLPIYVDMPEFLKLPAFDSKFSLSYEDCCQRRVDEILSLQERIDKPIRIMYSGGIDSSLVLISFIQRLGLENCSKRLQIVMSNLSKEENPTLWEKFIRRSNIPLINAFEQEIFQVTQDSILVTGELNDQLFHPATQTQSLLHWTNMTELLKPWSVEKLVDYFVWAQLTQSESEAFAGLLDNLARSAKFEIYSLWDLFWYLNFTGKWTSCYFQNLLVLSNSVNRIALEQGYLQHFFATNEFQQWTMVNKEHKHKGTFDSTKWYPRQLVANFLGDNSYLAKSKYGSLYHLIRGKQVHSGLDSNYCFVNPNDNVYYNSTNSFWLQSQN